MTMSSKHATKTILGSQAPQATFIHTKIAQHPAPTPSPPGKSHVLVYANLKQDMNRLQTTYTTDLPT